MPIRWSALELAEAMDEVEKLINEAEPFLAEAEGKATKATGLPNLPQYMHQRLERLIFTIQRRQDTTSAIARIHENIPKGVAEAERGAGKQLSLELDIKPCTIRKDDDFDFWLKQQLNR